MTYRLTVALTDGRETIELSGVYTWPELLARLAKAHEQREFLNAKIENVTGE